MDDRFPVVLWVLRNTCPLGALDIWKGLGIAFDLLTFRRLYWGN